MNEILIPEEDLIIGDALLKRVLEGNDTIIAFPEGPLEEGDWFEAYARHRVLDDPELRAELGLGEMSEEEVFYNAYYWVEAANRRAEAFLGYPDQFLSQQMMEFLEYGAPEDLDIDWKLIEDISRSIHAELDLPFPGDDGDGGGEDEDDEDDEDEDDEGDEDDEDDDKA